MIDLVKELSADGDGRILTRDFTVSAKVNEKLVVKNENIPCIFTVQMDSVDISVYWEEAGYKGFKAMGLFGKMNTKYQKVKRRDGFLYVTGDTFKLRFQL